MLIVHDADDREVSAREGRELAAAWPGAEHIETQGLGHRRILRAPDLVRAALRFLTAPPMV